MFNVEKRYRNKIIIISPTSPSPSLFHRFCLSYRLVGLVVKASASKAEDPGFESRLLRDFSGKELYQWLKNWHSSGYPARRLAL